MEQSASILIPWPVDDPALPPLPPGWRYTDVGFDPHDPDAELAVPADADRVRLYVAPYTFAAAPHRLTSRMPALQALCLQTAGFEHALPFRPDGVQLANGAGVHDAATSELAVGLILAALREIDDDARAMRTGTWLSGFTRSLADARVLIVGFGSIGKALARRLEPFECEVVPVVSTARDGMHGAGELMDLLPTADVVVLLCPLTPATRGLIGREQLAAMKPGALLVNMARGPVVVTDALVDACASGRVTAALDVTDPEPLPADHPLWHTPGVLISPHRGGQADAFWPRTKALAAQQITRFTSGRPLLNVVA